MMEKLPKYIRPGPYLGPNEDTVISIASMSPTTEEIQRLKDKVASLAIAPDIRIEFYPVFPDIDQLKELSLNFKADNLWNFDLPDFSDTNSIPNN